VSEDLKRHMVAEGFGAENVAVIYNGIDPGPLPDAQGRIAARKQLGVPADSLVIGTIGRLDPVKDLATLLRALAQCSQEVQALLVIIGDGPERPALEALARELSVDSRVQFLGHRDDARQWLPACDVYVNSSVSEGVSLTILEAMAAGLPVIATRVGGTPEVVTGECGLLVPARDAGALARALSELHRDLPRRASFGRAARSRVETHFTLDRMVREYADVYRSLTAGAASVRS
jgi:glycosyltransferase involved in cell wall biosynthesis